jgi:hypothetical protein
MPTGILTKSSEKAKKTQQPQPNNPSPKNPKNPAQTPTPKSQPTHPKTAIVHFSKMNKKEPSPFIHFWHRFSTIFF